MLKIIKKVHWAWYMLMVALFFYLQYPIFYFLTRKSSRYKYVGIFRDTWSSASFFLAGIFYKVHYEERLDKNKTYIYIANHTSYLDTPFMCTIARGNFHFMGKKEFLQNPILKMFFETIDIPVDRESRIGSFKAFKKAEENLQSGRSLVLFPEGTMSKNAPLLGDFKNGAFKLAIDKQVTIVPVSFVNNYKVMKGTGSKFGSRPGLLKAYVHKPIETKGMTDADADALKDRVVALIESRIN